MLDFSSATASLAAFMLAIAAGAPLSGCGTSESKAAITEPCANDNVLVCTCSCDGKEVTFNACWTKADCDDFVGTACMDAGGPASTYGSCAPGKYLDQCCS